MTKKRARNRFVRAYRFIRLQERARLSLAFDDDFLASDISIFISDQTIEEFDRVIARKVFESRLYSSVAANIEIRLARYQLVKSLQDAIHPVDRAIRSELCTKTVFPCQRPPLNQPRSR